MTVSYLLAWLVERFAVQIVVLHSMKSSKKHIFRHKKRLPSCFDLFMEVTYFFGFGEVECRHCIDFCFVSGYLLDIHVLFLVTM